MVHFTGIRAPITNLRKDEKFPDWYYIDVKDQMDEMSSIHVHKDYVEFRGLGESLVGMECEFMVAVLDPYETEAQYPYSIARDRLSHTRTIEGNATKDGKLIETKVIEDDPDNTHGT